MTNKYRSFSRTAQKKRKKFWMCERKTSYGQREAEAAAERLNQRAYECPHCGSWHLTKKETP